MIPDTRISIVAAIGENRELGANNKLLWHIPEDLKHFHSITMGHPIIMGRKTHESIGRVLSDRTNIIITRDLSYKVQGAIVVHSLNEAFNESIKYHVSSIDYKKDKKKNILDTKYLIHNTNENEIFVIGGGQIFAEAMPIVQRLYLTIVHADFPDADIFFPDYSQFTKVMNKKDHKSSEFSYTFLTLDRD